MSESTFQPSQTNPIHNYEDFSPYLFTYQNKQHLVYKSGEGPAVVVIHEVPGLHPGVLDFARILNQEGFTTYLPSLFGTPGKAVTAGYMLTGLSRLCVSKEFSTFATRKTSPAVEWLKALCRHAHAECGGPGVGAIGMCATGGFALAMAADPSLIAPVLSQPSLPSALTAKAKRDLGISDQELEAVKKRAETENLCVLGMRFTKDIMVPGERFKRLKDELGDAFIAVEIDSSPGNPWGIPRTAHSVVTLDLVNEENHPTQRALQQVIQLYKEKLKT